MWLKALEFICSNSSTLHGVICWKLLKQRRNISFINLLLAFHFFLTTILSYVLAHFLIEIGKANLFESGLDKEAMFTSCQHYITSYLTVYTMSTVPNIGIIFCRFIFVRYAHGLLEDMGTLFRKIALLTIGIFTVHNLLVWPTQALFSKTNYGNMLKKKICELSPLPDFTENIVYSIKPKLLTCFTIFLYLLCVLFFVLSSKNQKKRYSIPKARQNVLDLNQHFLYLCLIGFFLTAEQLVINVYVQAFHSQLGVKTVFRIWWIWQLVMFIMIHLIAPILIIVTATKEYPEFSDLKAHRYPGHEKPRKMKIEPRRDILILNTDYWKKYSKIERTKQENLPVRIAISQVNQNISCSQPNEILVDVQVH